VGGRQAVMRNVELFLAFVEGFRVSKGNICSCENKSPLKYSTFKLAGKGKWDVCAGTAEKFKFRNSCCFLWTVNVSVSLKLFQQGGLSLFFKRTRVLMILQIIPATRCSLLMF
jgi:hypothetical protein